MTSDTRHSSRDVTPDDESPFKLECMEKTVEKMGALIQLSGALGGQKGVRLASLVPVGNIITSIVTKDKEAYIAAVGDLRALISRKKRKASLQDLPAIAEINFMEGFDSFISFIYMGEAVPELAREVERDDDDITISLNSSPRSSPDNVNRRPVAVNVEQVPKKMDVSAKKNEPSRTSSRRGTAPPVLDDGEEEAEAVRPARRSARSQINDGQFNCVFDGCTAVFNSAMALIQHAKGCEHKSDLQLVFNCSSCERSFTSDKAIKNHIGHFLSKCTGATIGIGSGKSGEEKVKSASTRRSSNARRKSQDSSIGGGNNTSQVLECPFTGCTYSNDNFDRVYVHAKRAHAEYNTTFKCLKCGDTRVSGKAMKNHVDKCTGAKVELKLTKKDHEIPQWDTKLRTCPVKACKFISPAAHQLALHFKKTHSDSKLSFQCSKCPEASASVETVIKHCKTCVGSEPRVLVNGKTIGNKTELPRHSTVATPTMTTRKRGQPPMKSSSKRKKGAEVDVPDMPVPELTGTANDQDMAAIGEQMRTIEKIKREYPDSDEDEDLPSI